ncbi:transcription factor [Recurvomyces mirabilis]|uniref:Transcription factor n=1 Tax=Recurvomyces mirabilis TaxID=574656 RepID=A0AAE0WJP6_9PEZI|nr:transcription factor [Recurvomyces mirabilis]KAK5150961.1 transcription factor [Recurvomyces mirabilis]
MQSEVLNSIQLPLIRTKRHHRKSRFGCLACKRRRVKCDEKRPACTSCALRLSDCVYPTSPNARIVEPPAPGSGIKSDDAGSGNASSPSSTASSPRLILDAAELEVSGLELTQCYLSRVFYSFDEAVSRPERLWVWKVYIPTLAFTYSTVRDGMLTMGAIFLRFADGTPDTTKYVDAANFYGTRFVEESRKQLARLDSAESDANIACSRMLFVLGLAFHREYRRIGFEYSNPMMWTWAYMLSGVKTVFGAIIASGHNVDPTMLLEMTPVEHNNDGMLDFEIGSPAASKYDRLLAYITTTMKERHTALHAFILHETTGKNVEARNICLGALQSLHSATEQVRSTDKSDTVRVLCACIADTPPGLFNMLEKQHHAALAIHAHWLMMMMLKEELWVIDDMGRAGIKAILDVADTGEMGDVLRWPREATEVQWE